MLRVRVYPDPVLRNMSAPVEVIDAELRTLAEEMVACMYESDGVGLAAPQIGINKRLVVIDVSRERNDPHVLINPVLVKKSKEKDTAEEGCLSVPGISEKVTRPASVVVQAQDLTGAVLEYDGDGLLARCLQHEMDHLDGVLFVDKISTAAKLSIRPELEQMKEVAEDAHAE